MTSSSKKYKYPKLFEYRIKYNAEVCDSAIDNYHYYNAENAEQALDFHNSMMNKKKLAAQTLSVEKRNPYSEKWEDESEVIHL